MSLVLLSLLMLGSKCGGPKTAATIERIASREGVSAKQVEEAVQASAAKLHTDSKTIARDWADHPSARPLKSAEVALGEAAEEASASRERVQAIVKGTFCDLVQKTLEGSPPSAQDVEDAFAAQGLISLLGEGAVRALAGQVYGYLDAIERGEVPNARLEAVKARYC